MIEFYKKKVKGCGITPGMELPRVPLYDCFSKIWQLFEARLSKIIWDTVLTLA